VTDHLASKHLGLGGTAKISISFIVPELFSNLFNSRVDHTDTTLETIVELTLTTATGENLGLDNKITTTCNVQQSRSKGVNQ
jgi:hypothetical protein